MEVGDRFQLSGAFRLRLDYALLSRFSVVNPGGMPSGCSLMIFDPLPPCHKKAYSKTLIELARKEWNSLGFGLIPMHPQ